MFDSSSPPLLVQPVATDHITLFPPHDGYNIHPYDDKFNFVSYKRGWTIPLSLQMQSLVTEEPLLLVRNKGGITSSGSTSVSGYAHHFCNKDATPLDPYLKLSIFQERPSEEWMLVRNSTTIIWLQYSCKTQFIGSAGNSTIHFYYGKLLIRDFHIRQDFEPRLNRASDIITNGEKLYRVESSTIFSDNWGLTDEDTAEYLEKKLTDNALSRFWPTVGSALKTAMK